MEKRTTRIKLRIDKKKENIKHFNLRMTIPIKKIQNNSIFRDIIKNMIGLITFKIN